MMATMTFRNEAEERLVGTFVRGGADCSKCVLLAHGYASSRNGFQLPRLAAALAEAGFNSFRWDFSGSGDSEGTFRFGNYGGEVQEIRAAKQLVEQQLGQQVVALLGHSKGGSEVVLYASKFDGDIPLIINVAGRFNMREGITTSFGADIFERLEVKPVPAVAQRDDGRGLSFLLTKEDVDERVSVDMAAAAAAIRSSKVLTIHGSADTVIPVDDGRQFAEHIANSSLEVVEGACHNFRGQLVEPLVAAVLKFLRENTEQA